MVNWKKEIENDKNTINISFIDYDNIKFYTMKDLDEHFNKNKDNTNDNEYYNYINNKYKNEENKKKEKEEENKNISNINKNNYNKNNYNKNKYNNLFVYYYTYLSKKIIFLSPNYTSNMLKTLL